MKVSYTNPDAEYYNNKEDERSKGCLGTAIGLLIIIVISALYLILSN